MIKNGGRQNPADGSVLRPEKEDPFMAQLHALFVSGAVFQAGAPVRIFGPGQGNVSVSVRGIGDAFSVTVPSENGKWCVTLPPQPYDDAGRTVTVTVDGEESVLEEVRFGDVLLLAGQSNMQFKLKESTDGAEYEDDDLVRLFSTLRLEGGDRYAPEDGWVPCRRDGAGDWSAIGYQVGNLLRRKTGHAVGLITCYQGASVIESWMPPESLSDPAFRIPPEELHFDHHHEIYSVWNGDSVLWQLLQEEVVPFSVGRVLWYQGESDTSPAEAAVYDRELAAMIDGWRRYFRAPELPFTVIQIADLTDRADEGWRGIQEAQLRIASLRKNVDTVISRDVCEDRHIHPVSKRLLSARIADSIAF